MIASRGPETAITPKASTEPPPMSEAGKLPEPPAIPPPRSSEKDRWSVLLEYLKIVIAISSAVITASVVIYTDPSKRPTGPSKYVLLAGLITILITLVSSILAIARMSNIVLNADYSSMDEKQSSGKQIRTLSTISYFSIIFFAVLLIIFSALNTLPNANVTTVCMACDD
jgi:hypothetical protein